MLILAAAIAMVITNNSFCTTLARMLYGRYGT